MAVHNKTFTLTDDQEKALAYVGSIYRTGSRDEDGIYSSESTTKTVSEMIDLLIVDDMLQIDQWIVDTARKVQKDSGNAAKTLAALEV